MMRAAWMSPPLAVAQKVIELAKRVALQHLLHEYGTLVPAARLASGVARLESGVLRRRRFVVYRRNSGSPSPRELPEHFA